jgi:hypothetical protein
VNRALIKRGFFPAVSFDKANVVIFLSYGIGDPQEHQFSYSVPVWGQTGVSSSSTYGSMNTHGSLNTFGNYGSYQGNTSFSSTTTYTPSYGITGFTSHIGSYKTYFRFMLLDAYDLNEYKSSKKEVQLWKTTVTSTGRSGDLRRVFPILVAASKKHIGKNTGKKIQVALQDNDKSVIEIKGVGQEKLREEQVDRLKSFLLYYCWIYESKDIDKFANFFAHDALENNKPFHELLPEYRRNMEMIESFSYRIELVDYYLQTDTGRVNIQGKFSARYLLHGEALKEKSGNISMELIESGESYLVKRLNYTSQSSKILGEQPQWGPWKEIENKK